MLTRRELIKLGVYGGAGLLHLSGVGSKLFTSRFYKLHGIQRQRS